MTRNTTGNWRTGIAACATATLFSVSSLAASVPAADASPDNRTATPIKHVIIIVGENRSFDHLFATYVPKRKLWAETAIFVTVDEGGGMYDSGFIQPVDFFGTGRAFR